jgi:uncharacterized protein (DUF885 family)
MRNQTLALIFAACCFSAAHAAAPDAAPAGVESRVAAQNSLFEEYYQAELKAHPERATAFGDYRYNDRLEEVSLAAVKSLHDADQSFLGRLEAIPTKGFSEQDILSHEVLRNTLRQRIDNYGFKEYEMPVNQMDGPHLRLADLPLAVPFDTVKQYEDYIARLHQIPRVFTQTEEMPGSHRGRSLPAADEEIPGRHFSRRAAAIEPGDQRRGRQRSPAGL